MSERGMSGPRGTDELMEFLAGLGTADVAHSGGDFLHHLRAVHDLLAAHGAERHVAVAGLFHSIYGTEGFQEFSLPLSERGRVRELIGEAAEHLAWANCAMDRATFDEAVEGALDGACERLPVRERAGGDEVPLTRRQLVELAELHLFDWLEQVERSEFGWDYRRRAYRLMAELTNHAGLYDEVFAREPEEASR